MKKIIMVAAIVCAAAFANAAAIGWTCAGLTGYSGNAYKFLVIGQNGVESTTQIAALLDAGSNIDSYAFGSGSVSATGTANTLSGSSGKTLDPGTYTGFYVIFDKAAPVAGEANYALISGATGLTQTFTATKAAATFAAANQSGFVGDASNWKSFGSVPEPTSGLLLLLGMAGLALKRKVA